MVLACENMFINQPQINIGMEKTETRRMSPIFCLDINSSHFSLTFLRGALVKV